MKTKSIQVGKNVSAGLFTRALIPKQGEVEVTDDNELGVTSDSLQFVSENFNLSVLDLVK